MNERKKTFSKLGEEKFSRLTIIIIILIIIKISINIYLLNGSSNI